MSGSYLYRVAVSDAIAEFEEEQKAKPAIVATNGQGEGDVPGATGNPAEPRKPVRKARRARARLSTTENVVAANGAAR
jgi:hypothetical protein